MEFPPYVRLKDDVWLLDTLEFLQCVPLGENSWIEDDLSGKKWNKTDKKSLLFSIPRNLNSEFSMMINTFFENTIGFFIASIVPFCQLESPILAVFYVDAKLVLVLLCSFG